MLQAVYGVLFGLGLILSHLVVFLLDILFDPVAFLADPFNAERWTHPEKYRIDRFFQQLTKKRMVSGLRWDLLGDFGQDFLVTQLGQASRLLARTGPLHQTFNEFALYDRQTRRKVWTQERFAAFLASRLGRHDAAGPSDAAHTLWRCFCYNAAYPFAADSTAACQHLDLDSWVQAVALLATDAIANVGRNRTGLGMYDTGRGAPVYKGGFWQRFVSLAVPVSSHGQAADDDGSVGGGVTDDWLPPNVIDNVAAVASALAPLGPARRVPPLSEFRPRVRKLVSASESEPIAPQDFVVPYGDMLSLVCALLQLADTDTTDPGSKSRDLYNLRPRLSRCIDRESQLAVAKGILHAGGILEGRPVSFAQYCAFSGKFRFSGENGLHVWSFERELTILWRALFCVPPTDTAHPPSATQQQKTDRPSPPPLVLQALSFLYPFKHMFDGDYGGLQRYTRAYSSGAGAEAHAGLSGDRLLKEGLTEPFCPLLVVIYGTTTTSGRRQPAIFAIVTSSPLWSALDTGEIQDFYVDDAHVLMELAPRPRALRCEGTTRTKYCDIVTIEDDNAVISFGRGAVSATDTRTTRITRSSAHPLATPSGLTLNFNTGTAVLSSSPSQSAQKGRRPKSGTYAEIPVGPHYDKTSRLSNQEAWESVIRLQKVEVYTPPEQVLIGGRFPKPRQP